VRRINREREMEVGWKNRIGIDGVSRFVLRLPGWQWQGEDIMKCATTASRKKNLPSSSKENECLAFFFLYDIFIRVSILCIHTHVEEQCFCCCFINCLKVLARHSSYRPGMYRYARGKRPMTCCWSSPFIKSASTTCGVITVRSSN
jgi:hypothetical protein